MFDIDHCDLIGRASEMLCGGAVLMLVSLELGEQPAILLEPVIALFLGNVFAGEAVTGGEWIACGVILAGVFLIFRGKTAPKPE